MTEATTNTTNTNKAKTAKPTASPFGMPDYGMPKLGMPKFDLPSMEMPEAFRGMAEKGVTQAKDNYQKIQAAARKQRTSSKAPMRRPPRVPQTTTARSSRSPVQMLAPPLTTPMNCWERSPRQISSSCRTAHARKQFEAMTAQTKELSGAGPEGDDRYRC